jgi:hypothetical protein
MMEGAIHNSVDIKLGYGLNSSPERSGFIMASIGYALYLE